MKKLFTIAFIALFTFTSCSSDDSNNNTGNQNGESPLLKKIVWTDEGGQSMTKEFFYEGNRLIKTIDEEDIIIYSYENNLISKIEFYDVNNTLFYTDFISYNSNNKPSSVYSKEAYADIAHKSIFNYNNDGSIYIEEYYGNHESQNTLTNTYLNKYSNGNIVEMNHNYQIEYNNEDYVNYIITYDSKNNPLKNVFRSDLLLILTAGEAFTNNNVLTMEVEGQDITESSSYSYTYNSAGYPVSAIAEINGETITLQYIYE